MAITVSARYPGLSPQLYDEVVATLDLDANPRPQRQRNKTVG